MAIQKNIKSEITAPVVKNDNSITLTVVVLDAKSQPINGTRVSIKPYDNSLVTNSAGEVQFKLGKVTKYEITASNGSDTVTVPYYVTANGATRLVINPVYIKTVEAQLYPSNSVLSSIFIGGSIIITLAVILVIIWRYYQKITK